MKTLRPAHTTPPGNQCFLSQEEALDSRRGHWTQLERPAEVNRLLVDFLSSEDGQRVLQKADYLPAMPSVPAMKSGLRPQDGSFKATFLRPDDVYDRIPGWIKVVGDLFK